MDRDTVLEILGPESAELRQRFGLRSLALFGSVAGGQAGPESDVDLLVEFERTPGLSDYMALKFWLEDRLGRQVDLIMAGALEDWARPLVEAEAIRVA